MEATKFELTSLSHLHMSDLLTKKEEVESTGWTKALGTPKTTTTTKKQQTDIYEPFEVNKHCENLRDNFSAIWRQQNSAQGFILKLFWHLIINAFGEQNLYMSVLTKFCWKQSFTHELPLFQKR